MSRCAVHVVAGLLVVLLAALPAAPQEDAPPTPSPACAPLTTAQQVAQLIGAPLREPALTTEAQQLVTEHAGTVVLLGDAISSAGQVRTLTTQLDDLSRAATGLEPLVSVDEEGGRVARFGRSGVTTHLPSARDQARTLSAAQVRDLAADLGGQMAALGVDWDLAPVLDLTDADAGGVIGDRSWSADPTVAGAYGSAFAEGLQTAGLRTAGKHFPDHGLTTTDTHRAPATVDVDLAALEQVHLAPYRAAVPHLDAIMLSHLVVPALDPASPASLSAPTVAYLREALGAGAAPWDGVVVTDDLSMAAVAAVADQPTAAIRAVAGGVDMVLAGTPQAAGEVHERLLEAVEEGAVGVERLQEAARRVLDLKGVSGAETSCRLGLPPVAQAPAVRGGDGRVWLVRDGRRHLLPDEETARAYRARAHRYSADEVAGLPEGPPIPTVRRYQPAVVSAPGDDPLAVAVARSVQAHGPQGAGHVVVQTAAEPWGPALAALSLPAPPDLAGVTPGPHGLGIGTVLPAAGALPASAGRQALDAALAEVARPDAQVVVVGPGEVEGGGRPLTRLPADPVEAALAALARRDALPTAGGAAALPLVVAAPEAPLGPLLPLIASGDLLLLLSRPSADPRVRDRVVRHDGPVHSLGLPAAAAEALGATSLPEDPVGLLDWSHEALSLPGDLLVHADDGQLLAALPWAAATRAAAVAAGEGTGAAGLSGAADGGVPSQRLREAVTAWWLPPGSPRTAALAGVTPTGWTALGLPTTYRR